MEDTGLVVSNSDIGLEIFLMTPFLIVAAFGASAGWSDSLAALVVALAWLNTFTVLLRFPRTMSWAFIVLPWILLIPHLVPLISAPIYRHIPLYPWAFGIGFIHAAVYVEPNEEFSKWVSEF